MLPFPYVILDLETTGGTPLHDRIIEMALFRFEEGTESKRCWGVGAGSRGLYWREGNSSELRQDHKP
jgi:DNA polymerase III epsilon subunit-like protein